MSIPSYATAYTAAPYLLQYQLAFAVASCANDNETRIAAYKQACDQWVLQSQLNRTMGIPIDPKPVKPIANAVHSEADPLVPNKIWVWTESTGAPDPSCPDCPDLPAENVVKIGVCLPGSGGKWFACLYGDNMPGDETVTVSGGHFEAGNGAKGEGLTCPDGVYAKRIMFSGVAAYEKVK